MSIMLTSTMHVGYYTLSIETCLDIQGILFCFFGFILFYLYASPINLHNHVNSVAIALSITMIASSVFSFFQANEYITNNYMVIFILFHIAVATFLVVEIIFHVYTKKIMNDFSLIDNENPDFALLKIKNPHMLLTYLTVALTEGYPFVCNGKFISWVAQNYNWEPILIKLVRTTCIIPVDQDDYNLIFYNFVSHCDQSLSNKYLTYSLFILNSLHSTSHVSPKIRPIIKSVEGRMSQYQTICHCFSNSLTSDSNVNFLLFDSLGTMKNLLKRNIKYLLELYPNSPETLMLYQSYQLKVKRNKLKAEKYSDLIHELLKGSVLYNDSNYIQIFSGYQKIQRTLFTLHSNSNYNATAFPEQYDGKTTISLKNDFDQRKRNPFQTAKTESVVDFFQTKGLLLNKIMLIMFVFFIMSVMVSIFGGFGISTMLKHVYVKEINLVVGYRNLLRSYFSFYFRPLLLFTFYDKNNSSPFIQDQVSQTFHGIVNLRERLFEFREILQDLAQSFTIYNYNYIYLYDKSFIIPSYYDDSEVNSSIGVYLTRVTFCLFPFFQDNQTFTSDYSPFLRQSFIRIMDNSETLFSQSITNLSLTMKSFINEYQQSYFINFLYILIPFFVFLLIMLIIPVFYIQIMRRTHSSIIAKHANSNKKTFEYYLRSKFYTMKQFLSFYYAFLFLFLLLNLVYQFCNLSSLKCFAKTNCNDFVYHVVNDLNTYFYLSSPLSLFALSNLSQGNHYYRYTLMNDCLDYFMQATSENRTIHFSRASYDIYRYIDSIITIVTVNNYIPSQNYTDMILKIDQAQAEQMVTLLDKFVFPALANKYDQTYLNYKSAERSLTYDNLVCLSFCMIIIMVVLITSFAFIVNRLRNQLRAFLNLVHDYPNAVVNTSLIKSGHSKISSPHHIDHQNDEYKKILEINDDIIYYDDKFVINLNLLSVINKPAILIDLTNDNNVVVQANKLWLEFFDCSEEYAIGRPFTDFRVPTSHHHNNNDYQYIMSDPISLDELNPNFSMHRERAVLFVDTIPIEEELNEHIEMLKKKIIGVRTNHFPARFLNKSDEGTVNIGFHINLSIMLEPISNYEINPILWAEDIESYEAWIRNRCSSYDNVDVLNFDSREFTLLFGLNREEDPLLLALTAMTIACDALRWGIEYDWRTGDDVNLYMILTSGESADFVFKRFDNSLTLNMFGQAFYQKMPLREEIRPNSIVICTYIANLIRSYKTGLHVEEINSNAYIFSVTPPVVDDLLED